jgi:hypothetical protein
MLAKPTLPLYIGAPFAADGHPRHVDRPAGRGFRGAEKHLLGALIGAFLAVAVWSGRSGLSAVWSRSCLA